MNPVGSGKEDAGPLHSSLFFEGEIKNRYLMWPAVTQMLAKHSSMLCR